MSSAASLAKKKARSARSNSTSDSAAKSISSLYEVIADHPVDVAWAIASASSTMDSKFPEALLTVLRDIGGYELRRMFVKRTLDDEVTNTLSPTQLFRTGSPATRFMGAILHTDCTGYLSTCLMPLLDDAARATAARSLEIDPSRGPSSPDELARNIAEIEAIAQRFLDRLWATAGSFPFFVSELLEHAKLAAEVKFPAAHGGIIAVTGLLFLRFLAPAIVSPEMWNITPPQELSPDARRVLVIISKLVQTIANGTIVDVPDSFMNPLNPMMQRHFDAGRKFMVAVSTIDSAPPKIAEPTADDELMPKPLRDALKIVFKELENVLNPVLDALRENLELQQAVHDVVKPMSKAAQSARRIFGKTMKPTKQLPPVAAAVVAALGTGGPTGTPPATAAEDAEEEAIRKKLHQKVDDALGKLRERLADERQKRMQAEAEVARLKGLDDELHRERELRAKAEKDLKKARDEVENLKRKGMRGSKSVDEDPTPPPSPSTLEPTRTTTTTTTTQPSTPSPLGTSMDSPLSPLLQGTSPMSGSLHTRQGSAVFVPLPAPIPPSIQLQSITSEADLSRAIVKSLDEVIAQLPGVESHVHLVFVARVARELRKLEHIPLEEDFQFPAFAVPSRTPPPGTAVPSLDNEQVRGLRQVIPAVLQDVRAFVLALGINTGPNVLRRLRIAPPVINAVLTMLADLRSTPIPPPPSTPTIAIIPPPSTPPASPAASAPRQLPTPQRTSSMIVMPVDMPHPPPF